MSRKRPIYVGKAKFLYEGTEPGTIIQYFKDDATAFNAQKRGTIAGKDQKMLEGVADAGSGESRLLRTSLSDRSVVLLAEGDPIKVTMKLLFGLAFGLRPLKPAWVHDSLKKHEWLPPARQRPLASLPVSLPSSSLMWCCRVSSAVQLINVQSLV